MLDYVLRKTLDQIEGLFNCKLERWNSKKVTLKILPDLDFSESITLISEEIYQLQEKFNRLEDEAANVDFYCDSGKMGIRHLTTTHNP